MKNLAVWMALLILGGGLCGAALNAADSVEYRNGKVWVAQNNAVAEAKGEVTLPFDIRVQTNGTFTVKGGKVRRLQEGESLDKAGMLLRPNGTISPVLDHLTLNRGRVMVMKDGDSTQLKDRIKLGDGSLVTADGYLTPRSGVPRRLMDGELLRLEGGAMAAVDTVTMQKGRVIVQKDGSAIPLDPKRSIVMNDGTKVSGDGTVIRFNGEEFKIQEGETLVLDGVKTQRRR